MPHVMLRRDWNGTFKRTVKPLLGGESRRLEFSPGEVIEITPEEVPAIMNDLGKALLPVEWSDEKRKFVVVEVTNVDIAATVQAATEEPATEATEEPAAPADAEPSAEAASAVVEQDSPTVPSATEATDGTHTGRRHRR